MARWVVYLVEGEGASNRTGGERKGLCEDKIAWGGMYRGYRMLIPTLHSLCVQLVTENSGEIKTLLGTSVRQLGHWERNTSHGLVHYY